MRASTPVRTNFLASYLMAFVCALLGFWQLGTANRAFTAGWLLFAGFGLWKAYRDQRHLRAEETP